MAKNIVFNMNLKVNGKDAVADASADIKVLSQNVHVVNKNISATGASFTKWAQGVTALNALSNSIQQVSGFLNSLTEESRAFAGAMKEANTMAGKGAEDFAMLKSQVADLSKNVPMARDALARGLYQVISNGVPEDNWISYLERSSKAAVGGLANLEEVVKVTSTVIKNYGLEWSAAEDIQDKIQLTAKNGVTSFEQLAAALPSVTGQAAQLGVSFTEMLAVMSTLTGVTGNTSEVSTQLASVLTALTKESSKSQKMAEAMGISFDAASIKAAGGFRNFLKELDKEVTAYANKTGQLRESIYSKLFGRAEAIRLVNGLTGQLSQKFDENIQALENSAGTINEAFDTMAGTGSARLQLLKNKFGEVTDAVADAVSGMQPFLNFGSQLGMTAVSVISLTSTFKRFNFVQALTVARTKAVSGALLLCGLRGERSAVGVRVFSSAIHGGAYASSALKLALRGLMAATGVGIAIAALTTVIEHFIGKSSDAEEAASGVGRSMGVAGEMAGRASQRFESTQSETYSRLMTKFKQLQAEWAKLTDNLSRTKWITVNSAAFKDLGLKIDGVKDAEKVFAGNTDTVVEAFKARAKAAAQMAQMEEEYRIQSEAQSRLEKANAQAQARHRVEAGQVSGTGEFHAGGHTTEGGLEEINSAGRWVYTAAGAARHNAQRYVANNAEARNLRRALAESQDRMRRIEAELAKGTETPTAQANRGGQVNRSNQTNSVKKGISYADQIKAEYEAAEREQRIGEERLKDEAALDEAVPVRLKAEWETKPDDVLDDWDNLFKSTPIVDVNKELDNVQRSMEAVAAKKAAWQKEMEDNGSMLESIGSIGQSFSQLGQTIGGVGGNMISLLGQLATTAAETIGKLIALAAAEGSVNAFRLPWPASLAAWATVIAAITSATASIAGFAGMKFANGGLAYGPTVGMVGEYAGASQNPEVIAPLDKLRTLIEPRDTGGLSGRVVFRVKGRELEGVLERQRRFEGRT